MESMTDWAFSWPISVWVHMISYHSVVGLGALLRHRSNVRW